MSEELVEPTLPQKEIRINSDFAFSLISNYPVKTISGKELDTEKATPTIEKRSLTTSDYFSKLSKTLLATSSILPQNCRYMEKLNRGHLVVIEDPPCLRTIAVDVSYDEMYRRLIEKEKITKEDFPPDFLDTKPYRFNVALPYMVFIMFVQKNQVIAAQVFGRISRLSGFGDYLLKIPFANISSDQYICFGELINKKGNSLNHAIEYAQNVFWSASFNVDYTYNITAYKDIPIVNNYFEWHVMSQKDPMFIYDIPWIKMKTNLNDEINRMKEHVSATSSNQLTFKELEEVFVRPISTGITLSPFAGSKVKQELIYDVAQGIYIVHHNKDLFVNVGDHFSDKKQRKLYISSFMGLGTSEHIKFIEVYREDKKRFVFKYTKKLAEFVFNQVEKSRYTDTATMKDGKVIKQNDILKIKRGVGAGYTFGKVQFIRHGRQYGHQAKIGNEFHIVENLEAELFNAKEPEIYGKKLKPNETYLYIRNTSETIPLMHGSLVKFSDMDVNSSGNMIAMFKCNDRNAGDTVAFGLNDIGDKPKRVFLFDKSEFIVSKQPSYRCGRRVLMLKNSSGNTPANSIFFTKHGVAVEKNYRSNNLKIADAESHFIKEDVFSCNSYDLNLNFAIGEKVIAVDWKNPLGMLMVKTIAGFKVDKEYNKIYFILTDKNNNVSQTEYYNAGNGIIHTGKIRKITNEFEGFKAGTKILSRNTRVTGFPKKDVNIIIGFITDGGTKEPLVLCSNCQTLWLSDLEGFELIKFKTKKWERLQHAPIDISKIKYQPGDIIQGVTDVITNGGWFIWNQLSGRMRVTPSEYLVSAHDSYALDGKLITHTLLDSIPNPRLSSGQLAEIGFVTGFPNFHGGFTKCDWAPFFIPNDPRSFVNV